MKLSKLKELLESGSITQEEYDEMAKTAEDDTKTDPPQEGLPKNDPSTDPEDSEKKLEKMVQAAVDRATNKLGNENKKLKGELEKERKKNLSADELKQLELQEKERELAQKEQEIKEKENRMYAIKALKKAELDDGSEETLDLVEFVLGEDETAIDVKVKALQKFAQRVAKYTTDGIYKANGRTPGKGNAGSGQDNPWSKDSWNLTKQMELEINNPELAKTLKTSAGK
ncbi:hypothetical protein C0033_08895 [Clostridium sp. chh4-2]|uniref:capsid assembly scaffolding protein Gp46 family protein n=1 Tax=Clostridium sp. chh4-2 TaxID=2067550 RepID=UPI000CCF33BF|nr:DUF4355 domain-containing protein [Clostridium sp. chh4-2]PNV62220.1 hypothetical protein C0033_08895 [Clostridium sp. chh4-2]